ncbi:unnamed protein product [Mesocestoides corti]|uniref:peptidylprolyl isomerase n=1 Tax=Mesocestoides corti TaxID=53468 RepID=A0A0R3U7V1_MESCO|nr:unnamed protein product [Mesocestoides corti]
MADDIPSLEDFFSLTEDRGVLKKVIKEGKRDIHPIKDDTVVVHYVGTFHGGSEHGQKFDSSRDREEPFKFRVGKSEVIKAWDLAIPTMKPGEICEIVAFPDYAYFDGKTRRFEIELIDFYGNDVSDKYDGTLLMSTMEKGNAAIQPKPGVTCEIHIKGFCDGQLFDERDISYTVGDFEEAGIPEGLDRALTYMNKDGKARVRVLGCNSFSETEYAQHGLPKDSPLEYEVTVMSCEVAGKYKLALKMYHELQGECFSVVTDGCKEDADLKKFRVTLHLNKALVGLKMKSADSCLKECQDIIQLDPLNEKCFYRQGEAYLLRGDHEEALVCFKKALRVNPENSEAARKIKMCETTLSDALRREKTMFQNAFKRLGDTTSSGVVDEVGRDSASVPVENTSS